MDFKTRIRSYSLWVSIVALIPMFAQAMGWHGLPDNFEMLINALLGTAIAMGILNNPTTETKGFSDDVEK